MTVLNTPSTQGPAKLTPTVDVAEDRLVIRTWDYLTMAAAEVPIVINRGGRFQLRIVWADGNAKARDLTDWTATLRIVQQYGDLTPLVELTGTLETPAAGDQAFLFDVTGALTAAYSGWTRAQYTVVAANGTDLVRLMEGTAELRKAV